MWPARRVLADPRARLGPGAAVTLLTAIAAHENHVGAPRPARSSWSMGSLTRSTARRAAQQLGPLGAALAAAGSRVAGGRPRARRRPWPAARAPGHCPSSSNGRCGDLGQRPSHRGAHPGPRSHRAWVPVWPCGRSGCAQPCLPSPAHPAEPAAAITVAPLVGLSRIYAGAHFPLDIVGGAALGFAVEAAVALLQQRVRRENQPAASEDNAWSRQEPAAPTWRCDPS